MKTVGESGIIRRAPKDGSGLAGVIRAYMRTHGIETLGEMADILDVDRTLVSKYVNGARLCHDVTQLRRFAEAMDVSPETLGLMPEPDHAYVAAGAASDAASEWQLVRRKMNRNRSRLTKMVADLYWDPVRIEGTTCITLPDWMPPSPVDLSAIELSWKQDAAPPEVNGQEPEAAPYRAAGPESKPYRRYSQAISALARPALFDNRGSYRLLDLAWDAGGGRMSFGYTTYFDMVDVCEVLAHEAATAWVAKRGRDEKLTMDDLPFRQRVGDLFNLARRPVLPSINTLTIRRGSTGDSFFLHRRSASKVAMAGGTSHVIPAGVFQPSGIAPWNMSGDFDLWRSIMREYSEELLGNPEHDGSSGAPIDYGTEEPFRTLNAGRREGKIRPWCLGFGFDPLAPAGEILTVVVMDADVFDEAFRSMVAKNAEGDIYPSEDGAVGIAWTPKNIRLVQAEEPLACAAAACIALTWKHRDLILGE